MSRQPLNRRLDRLEKTALARQAEAEAARIGAMIGADPETLLARAQEIARDVERHGLERTIEIVAHANGITAEELEARARRFARVP